MRKPLIVCLVFATAGGVTASLATAKNPSTRNVKVGDNWFYKDKNGAPKITVKKRARIRFKFVGNDPHNVLGYRAGVLKFESPIKTSGYYKTPKLTRTGTYTIICDIHGEFDQSMKIKVKK